MRATLINAGILLLLSASVLSQTEVCKDIDLTIILDHSGSIFHIEQGWEFLTTAASNVIQELEDRSITKNSNVALFLYNDDHDLIFNLGERDTASMNAIVTALVDEEPRGYTNSSGVLYADRMLVFNGQGGDRDEFENVLLFLTDGKPTKGFRENGEVQIVDDHDFTPNGIRIRNNLFNQVKEQTQLLRDGGVRIVTVGFTDNINVQLLQDISDTFMYKDSPLDLLNSVPEIVSVVCDARTVTTMDPTTTTTAPPTTTTTAPPTTTTTAPPTTTTTLPTAPPPLTDCFADIAILVDASGSITDASGGTQNWEDVKTFLEQLVESFGPIGGDASQVSLILFSYSVEVVIPLGQTDKAEILNTIRNLPHLGSWTATAPALQTARTDIFESGANRADAENFIILLTDGKPTRYLDGEVKPDKAQEDPEGILLEDEVIAEVDLLTDLEVAIVVVGVTDEVDMDLMNRIVKSPEDFLMVDNFVDLGQSQIGQLRDRACGPVTTTPPPLLGCSIDLVLLMDASGSIQDAPGGANNWQIVKTFVTNFVIGFINIPDTVLNVAIICFADQITTPLPFAEYNTTMVENTLVNLEYKGGYTATAAALEAAMGVFRSSANRDNAADFLALMTDGYPTQNINGDRLEKAEVISDPVKRDSFYLEVTDRADILKDEGVTILGIAVTSETDEDLLMTIVSDPTVDFFKVDDFSGLEAEEFGMQIRTRLKEKAEKFKLFETKCEPIFSL